MSPRAYPPRSKGRRKQDRWLHALTDWRNLLILPATFLGAAAFVAISVPNHNTNVTLPTVTMPTAPPTTGVDIAALEERLANLQSEFDNTRFGDTAQRAALQAEIDNLRAELARLNTTTTSSTTTTTRPVTTTTSPRTTTTRCRPRILC